MDNPLITYLQLFRPIPEEDLVVLTNAFEQRSFAEGNNPDRAARVLLYV